MRILYISQFYAPEMGGGAARVTELAGAWAAAGHRVTVLTGFPNHPTGVVPPEYRRLRWRGLYSEHQQGVHIMRVPHWCGPNRGTVRRSIQFASLGAALALVAPWLGRQDVVIATSPQPLVGLAGATAGQRWRVPFIFEIRDLWPEQLVAVGYAPTHVLVKSVGKLVRYLYRSAANIVTVTPDYSTWLASEYGVAAERMTLIPNGVDVDRFHPGVGGDRARWGFNHGQLVIGFAGTLGMSHDFRPLLEAAAHFQVHNPDIRFLVVGEGAERAALQERVRSLRLTNFRLEGPQLRAGMPALVASLDIGLILLSQNPYFDKVIPSKIFELMAMERPLLLAARGPARAIMEAAECGLAFTDTAALIAAIRTLAAQPERRAAMGASGRRYVTAHYARPMLAARYLELMERLVQERQERVRRTAAAHG